ncbi:DUF951 domain-containing protein [Fusibacter sp. JL216-2]|uniref:DUF951 domain-containing protein n=1 Tax=Fusibacter sp. JL216-2 TaxID=3071453 RepID=UPI003D337F81
MPMDIQVGDVVETKKNHPCGGNTFEVLRVGMDFRIRCTTCDKQLWIERPKLEKRVRKLTRDGEEMKTK